MLRLNLAPGPMLDFLGALGFRAACAAHKLNIFQALETRPMTPAELADEIGADSRGIEILLRALASIGYVDLHGGRFRNSAMTSKWLPVLSEGLSFFDYQVERWKDLDYCIRLGKPNVNAYDRFRDDAQWWRSYQKGMTSVAKMTADEVLAKVTLSGNVRTLVDVGGGHGLHAIKFCQRYTSLSATVFDLPQAAPLAREMIVREGMCDRVSFVAGDFWTNDLGNGFDIALAFNLLHFFPSDRNGYLLKRIARSLKAGGTLLILDQLSLKVSGSAARALTSLLGLDLFVDTGGQTYGVTEFTNWLKEAGFAKPRLYRLRGSPGFGLIRTELVTSTPHA